MQKSFKKLINATILHYFISYYLLLQHTTIIQQPIKCNFPTQAKQVLEQATIIRQASKCNYPTQAKYCNKQQQFNKLANATILHKLNTATSNNHSTNQQMQLSYTSLIMQHATIFQPASKYCTTILHKLNTASSNNHSTS